MADTDDPYNAGGFCGETGSMSYTLADDECLIVRRAGKWCCVREHEHGDTTTVDTMNLLAHLGQEDT